MGSGESTFELRKFAFPILCALNTGFAGTSAPLCCAQGYEYYLYLFRYEVVK